MSAQATREPYRPHRQLPRSRHWPHDLLATVPRSGRPRRRPCGTSRITHF